MPSRSEIAYFGAGPAPLPTPIIERSASAFINFESTGLSLAEISHRSPTANKILQDAKDALTTLYDIPSQEYEILFMQGGGTGEFSATVQNLVGAWIEKRRRRAVQELGEGEDVAQKVLERVRGEVERELKVDYLVTGSWSLKASQEATRLLGARYVNVGVDARKANGGKFGVIPGEGTWTLSDRKGSAFTYFCDNETVDGVEFPAFPGGLEGEGEEERIVVADMSSNFLSRKVDMRKYGLIFVSILSPSPSIFPHPLSTISLLTHLLPPLPRPAPKKPRHPRHHRCHHPQIPPLPRPPRFLPARLILHAPHLWHPPTHHVLLLHHRLQQLPLQHPAHLQSLRRHSGSAIPRCEIRPRQDLGAGTHLAEESNAAV